MKTRWSVVALTFAFAGLAWWLDARQRAQEAAYDAFLQHALWVHAGCEDDANLDA